MSGPAHEHATIIDLGEARRRRQPRRCGPVQVPDGRLGDAVAQIIDREEYLLQRFMARSGREEEEFELHDCPGSDLGFSIYRPIESKGEETFYIYDSDRGEDMCFSESQAEWLLATLRDVFRRRPWDPDAADRAAPVLALRPRSIEGA